MKLPRLISATLGRFTEKGHHGHWDPEVEALSCLTERTPALLSSEQTPASTPRSSPESFQTFSGPQGACPLQFSTQLTSWDLCGFVFETGLAL